MNSSDDKASHPTPTPYEDAAQFAADALAGAKATPPEDNDIKDDPEEDAAVECYRKYPCILDPMDSMVSVAELVVGRFYS